jgi:UDP-GlcNAc:undecaprenyl-phosphate/decaprenyl-phosphate GlcNAc-1-phosphate transferase
LGFLRYNSHPARVFMGDSGSQILGFTLGFLAVYLTQVAHTAISAALPLLLLGLPVADLLVVFYQRIRGGHNWFRATRNHLHHRLLELGFNHYETVIIIYSVQALLVACGVSIRYETDWTVAGVYFAVVGGVFAGVVFAERTGRRVRRGSAAAPVDAAMSSILGSPLLRRAPLAVISVVVPGFMLFASLWVAQVPRDFSIAAAVLACLVLAELLRPRRTRSIVLRITTYVAATFSAYLLIIYPGVDTVPGRVAAIAVIAVLAVAIAVYVRFSERQEFGTTPTDYLVAFGMLVLVASAFVDAGSRTIFELVAYAVVLLYGCEIAFVKAVQRWPLLHVATCASLAILAVRGVL